MANYERRQRVQWHSHPSPQHLFCSQPQQLGPHYGGPALGIWCERCRRTGHEAKMCAARIPRSPPQYSGSHSYCAKPFVRHYSGGDGTALWQQRQQVPRPFSSSEWEQRYNGGHSTALWPQQQPAPPSSVALARSKGTLATIDRR